MLNIRGREYMCFLSEADVNDYLKSGGHFHKNRAAMYMAGECIIVCSMSELLNAINEIVHSKTNNSNRMHTFGVLRVRDSLAQQIKGASKGVVNTCGYFVQIEPNDLKHSYNEHHLPKQDCDLPMSEEDMAYAIANINDGRVIVIEDAHKGRRAIIEIPMEDGTITSIYVISKRDGALSLKNMWKEKKQGKMDTLEDIHPGTKHSHFTFDSSISSPTNNATAKYIDICYYLEFQESGVKAA